MPLYAFEGGGNRTVFSCRSCASRLILACHLVCALISSGINTRYLNLVYAPVKAKLEHFGATTPRLLSSAAKHLALLWLRLCHLHLGNSDYFACKNLPIFAQSGDETQWRRHFHNPFLSHDRSILAHRQMLTRSLSTARKHCLRFHATTHNKQI